ncbi:MAG: hypothetical protein OQK95_08150 [Gammaproteobacteria bacterium]|nr:hypothetical protein [Gammaproteobacteria bacterium]MCW9032086.1 hypothetical protein [Gammaproteobacteria bacterium]
MFAFDIPIDIQEYKATPVHIASKSQQKKSTENFDYIIGVCSLVKNPPVPEDTAENVLSPRGQTSVYLREKENRKLDWSHWSVKVLSAPQHAELKESGSANFHYIPTEKDYLGPDKTTFLVEIGEITIKVIYHFKVMRVVGGTDGYDPYVEHCPKGIVWKISSYTSNLEQSGITHSYSLNY